jgi:hypothetical protein
MIWMTFYWWWNENDVRTPCADNGGNCTNVFLRMLNGSVRHTKTLAVLYAENLSSTLSFLRATFRSATCAEFAARAIK